MQIACATVGNRQPAPRFWQYVLAALQPEPEPEAIQVNPEQPVHVQQLPLQQLTDLHVPLQLLKPVAQPQALAGCPDATGLVTVIVPFFCTLVQPFEFFTVTVKAVLLLNCWVVIVLAGVVLVEPPIFQV